MLDDVVWEVETPTLPDGYQEGRILTGPTSLGYVDVTLNGRAVRLKVMEWLVVPAWAWQIARESGFTVEVR